MSECLIDKVAKALADSLDDGLSWMEYRGQAIKAIEAMRIASNKMLAAGWVEVNRVKAHQGIARLGPGAGLTDSYTAMIDEALKGG